MSSAVIAAVANDYHGGNIAAAKKWISTLPPPKEGVKFDGDYILAEAAREAGGGGRSHSKPRCLPKDGAMTRPRVASVMEYLEHEIAGAYPRAGRSGTPTTAEPRGAPAGRTPTASGSLKSVDEFVRAVNAKRNNVMEHIQQEHAAFDKEARGDPAKGPGESWGAPSDAQVAAFMRTHGYQLAGSSNAVDRGGLFSSSKKKKKKESDSSDKEKEKKKDEDPDSSDSEKKKKKKKKPGLGKRVMKGVKAGIGAFRGDFYDMDPDVDAALYGRSGDFGADNDRVAIQSDTLIENALTSSTTNGHRGALSKCSDMRRDFEWSESEDDYDDDDDDNSGSEEEYVDDSEDENYEARAALMGLTTKVRSLISGKQHKSAVLLREWDGTEAELDSSIEPVVRFLSNHSVAELKNGRPMFLVETMRDIFASPEKGTAPAGLTATKKKTASYAIKPTKINGEVTSQSVFGTNFTIAFADDAGRTKENYKLVTLRCKLPKSAFFAKAKRDHQMGWDLAQPAILQLGDASKKASQINKDGFPIDQRLYALSLEQDSVSKMINLNYPSVTAGQFTDRKAGAAVTMLVFYDGDNFDEIWFLWKP